jgi:uncharacterized protein
MSTRLRAQIKCTNDAYKFGNQNEGLLMMFNFSFQLRNISAISLFLPIVMMMVTSSSAQQLPVPRSDRVTEQTVTIWSDGTRLAADVYKPKDIPVGIKLPTIVFCPGWGGSKNNLRRIAIKFAEAGFIGATFDYRTWGESEGKIVIQGEIPKLDEQGMATVQVQVIRDVVNPLDMADDIRRVIDYLQTESGVDTNRIGLWGTSYGGGLAAWVGAHDDRVKCISAQVPSMGLIPDIWEKTGRLRAIQQARGEIEPIPQEIDTVPNLRGTPHLAKMIHYNVINVAHRVNVPTIIIDAENEELVKPSENGAAVYEIIKARGNVPVAYHLMKNTTHYGMYNEKYEASSILQLAWFNKHLNRIN